MIKYSLHKEHLEVRMYGSKEVCMVLKAPNITKMNEKLMQIWVRWRSKVFFLSYFFFKFSVWSGVH